MILELGINRVAKQISSPEFSDGLRTLKELSRQASAEDKMGSFTASAEIFIIAILISVFAYSLTIKAFPPKFITYYRDTQNKLNDRYKPREKQNLPNEKDFFDFIMDNIHYILGGSSLAGGGIIYIKKKRKAARQRAMEQALQDEMDRLKEHLEQELKDTETASAAGVTNNKPSLLSGANIVELFNSFADLMAIQGDLPRNEDETALEYFEKVSESVNFPKNESLKAARYFDDELYAKKNSTKEDKASFMKLVLEMLGRINKKTLKK